MAKAVTQISARVVLDSVSPAGARLTTMEWTYPRFIHSEVLTYRMFSRNGASSRAIPLSKTLRRVIADPAAPVYWGRNQSGMQARQELEGWRRWLAIQLFIKARYFMVAVVWLLSWLPLHKQIANRLLEPWLWMTVVVTGSPVAFENVWRQRCHPDAQPEFQALAVAARLAYDMSRPQQAWLHTPYVYDGDRGDIMASDEYVVNEYADLLEKVSVARCARVSYLTHDGRRDFREDLKLYGRLHLADPDGEVPHTSPAEHAARAHDDPTHRSGNVFGWETHRERVDPYFIHAPVPAPTPQELVAAVANTDGPMLPTADVWQFGDRCLYRYPMGQCSWVAYDPSGLCDKHLDQARRKAEKEARRAGKGG